MDATTSVVTTAEPGDTWAEDTEIAGTTIMSVAIDAITGAAKYTVVVV